MNAHSWYAVFTRSNFEKAVTVELDRKGIEAYLPAVKEMHRWKDRRKEVEVPVFRSYLFARITDTPENRLRILRTTGAIRILGSGSSITAVHDLEIESIRRLVSSGREFSRHPYLSEGAWVRVKYGPLEGVEGRLLRIKNRDRLVLSVEILARSVVTEIDGSDVELVARDPRTLVS